MLIHRDRLFPAEPSVRKIAKALYEHVRTLPIISPHGHTQAAWFAGNEPFPDAAKLFVQPDHYIYRMLYSQGVSLEDLEIGQPEPKDPRKVWLIFASHYYLFRGTPTRMWLDFAFQELFGLEQRLSEETADAYFDTISEKIRTPEFLPRALYERYPTWYFYLFWLPSYFSAKFNLNLSHLGLPLIIVYNVSAIGSIGGGWLPTPSRRLGLSPNYARLTAMIFCAALVVPIYTASSVKSLWAAIALISVAAGAHQGWSANLFTTSSDMFPRSAVGSVVGIGGMAGSVGSALFAFFAGHILHLTHSYASLFVIAASAYLWALVILYLLAPGLKKVEFTA
jgi:hypothetical protein